MRGVGGGVGGLPSGITFGRVPVTRNAEIDPPPAYDDPGVMTPLAKIAIFGHPPLHPLIAFQQHPWAGRKRVRIASLFSLFSFAIFLDSTKRIFPDSGVPYPLVSTVGFAIFGYLQEPCEFAVLVWGQSMRLRLRLSSCRQPQPSHRLDGRHQCQASFVGLCFLQHGDVDIHEALQFSEIAIRQPNSV